MRGRKKRRTTRRRRANNRTTTLGDVTNDNPALPRVLCDAALLGKHPRCSAATARKHAAAVQQLYGLAIDDLQLRLAVACGGLGHLDASRRQRVHEVGEWWARSYRGLYDVLQPTNGTSTTADPILDGLLAEYITLTRRFAAYAKFQRLPLDEVSRRIAKAGAARAVAAVFRHLSGRRRDWQMVVRLLEYYGWDCGSGGLRHKADALRKLVERRTPGAR